MKKIGVICAVAMLLLVAAAGAQPFAKAAGAGGDSFFTHEDVSVVLYDQTDNASGNGAPDQDFEAAFDGYDSEGADDFDVDWPDGWIVQQVNTVGSLSAGGVPGGAVVDVTFYTDNGGTPLGGAVVCTYNDVPPTADVAGSLTVDLPTDCVLPAGLHWMAIQVNQNFGTFGQHFWSNRATQNNAPSHWRNPGDGFGTGCVDWTPQTTCAVGGGLSPDFLFTVAGELGVAPANVLEIPTAGRLGLLLLLMALAGAGIYLIRR